VLGKAICDSASQGIPCFLCWF